MTPGPVEARAGRDPWAELRAATGARVGLGRAGDALPTARVLELAAAHALARDAVHDPLVASALQAALPSVWADGVVQVASAAPDRATYLRRPDLGRRLRDTDRALLAGRAARPTDLAVILADGLSARAVHAHAPALLAAVLDRLEGWRIAPVVVAEQARVALGDEVGELLGARLVLVLIGERPGLSAPDSLGAYLTWDPRSGRRDSERNCVSNIRPPQGLTVDAAAVTIVNLLTAARNLELSGVDLKDDFASLEEPGIAGPAALS